ncbi:MAG TPA: YjcZ family sporulation protein [Paenisporosarcina sp.]|nr:YjcZ family sporulation protein [Paenisporosarcina sp.]
MDYYGGYGGYACGGYSPCGQYEDHRKGSTFALIVVLFILLIIIGATFHQRKC